MTFTSLEQRTRYRDRLENGCHGCDFDEAEGGLMNHCDECCRWLTEHAYEMFVIRMEWPDLYDTSNPSLEPK